MLLFCFLQNSCRILAGWGAAARSINPRGGRNVFEKYM